MFFFFFFFQAEDGIRDFHVTGVQTCALPICVFDPRYRTDKNVTVLSTFKDVSNNYKISKIDNMLGAVIVYVKELNAMLTIDKKELPANIRFDSSMQIEAIHIPDNAKIKYFFLNWNKS